MFAVTDTSPLHYLILIGQVNLLSHLYTHVIIPQAVVGELLHPHTPPDVRAWMRALPPWCDPCSRGSQTRRIIFLMRRELKPRVIHPKGLADESMRLLPAMNLPDFRPVHLKMYQSDLRKRRQYDSGNRHRRFSLLARNALALLL